MLEISVCSSHPTIHGLPESALHEVARATTLARLLYASPAWWGFASASDRTRVERFLQRTIRMGYLPHALPDAAVLVSETETRLLASVVLRPHHVLRPLLPTVMIRRPGLRPRPHNFVLPDKDDCNFIPRILYRALLQ